VRLWDVATGKPTAVLSRPWYGVHRLCFSPDGKRLAVVGLVEHAVRMWDLTGRGEVGPADGHVTAVLAAALLAEPRSAATIDQFHIRVWDRRTGAGLEDSISVNGFPIRAAVFSADGRRALVVFNRVSTRGLGLLERWIDMLPPRAGEALERESSGSG